MSLFSGSSLGDRQLIIIKDDNSKEGQGIYYRLQSAGAMVAILSCAVTDTYMTHEPDKGSCAEHGQQYCVR